MSICHDHIRLRSVDNWRLAISLAALGLQAIVLFFAAHGVIPRMIILAIATVVTLAQLAANQSQSLWRAIDMAISMTLVGGLGMAFGGLLDSRGSTVVCAYCQSNSLFTWSNGLMLVFCSAGCRLLFRRTNKSCMLRFGGDCFCQISMMAGMFLGEFLLMPMFRHSGYVDAVMHWVMLLGMFFGNVAGLGACDILGSSFLPAKILELSEPKRLYSSKSATLVGANNR